MKSDDDDLEANDEDGLCLLEKALKDKRSGTFSVASIINYRSLVLSPNFTDEM